jgi:hypothetical protein
MFQEAGDPDKRRSADDSLKDAHHLAARGGNNPTQSTLRRAVSTAYYALFHLLITDFTSNWRVKQDCFGQRALSKPALSFSGVGHSCRLAQSWQILICA